VNAFLLTCCVRGMEVTRHYTAWQGTQVVAMLSSAVAVAGLIIVGGVFHRAWRALHVPPAGRAGI
jgi:hypothetical protein